jgi:hypothetical protein
MIRALLLTVALTFGISVFAGPQQDKMRECNKQATGKSGGARKDFMKTCLASAPAPAAADAAASQLPPPGSQPPPPPGKMSPQERMKKCNQDAVGKKGAERTQFMSQCLKGA